MKKNNSRLPLELIHLVLSHLSPRHLLDAALVCYAWSTIAQKVLHQLVYIQSNRQYTRWLRILKAGTLSQRRLVRNILIHPKVHIDLAALPLYDLCPWVESFKIGTPSKDELDINNMIGQQRRMEPVHWNHLRYLSGHHSHSTTLSRQSHCLKGLMCSFDDFITTPSSWSSLVDLHLTFGFTTMEVGLLETLTTPVLRTLKLNTPSLTGSSLVTPIPSLTCLALYDLATLNPECYPTLLCKFPNITSLHLGFSFDEFYTLDTDTTHDIRLFDLISRFAHLTRLTVHFQGANNYVTRIWPTRRFIDWMQTRHCGLRGLEIIYQRQTTPEHGNMLGLEALTHTWVAQHQLDTLVLNVYTLPHLQPFNALVTLCLSSCPGFYLSIARLVKIAPRLKVLNLTFATLVGGPHTLKQLWINSSRVIGDVVTGTLQVICMNDVELNESSPVWDLSGRGLTKVALHHVTLDSQRIQALKLHEAASDRNTWYNGTSSFGNRSLELRCDYAEDVYFS